jgi:two-component system chemotaxis sensor kinase CheA
MSSALMALESAPADRAPLDAIFREAHTMKGTAGMVGLMRVSHLAHRLEDLLSEVRSGTSQATPDLIDSMLKVLDGLSRLLAASVNGEPAESDPSIDALMAPSTRAAAPEPAPPTTVQTPPEPPIEKQATSRRKAPKRAPASQPSPTPAPAPTPAAAPPPSGGWPAVPAQVAPGVPVNRRRLDSATLEVPVARMDELNRLVGEASAAQLRVGAVIGTEVGDPDTVTEYRDLTKVLNRLQEVTERARMVPVGTLEPILHRTIRDTARNAGKNVRWEIQGEDTEIDRGVLEQLVAPLLHIVRNAVGHGIELPAARMAAGKPEQAVVSLHVSQVGSKVELAITDDGAGIDVAAVRAAAARNGVDVANLSDQEALRLIFRTGVSTSEVITEDSGRGVGLDVVTTAVSAVRGQIEVSNHPGSGCEFRIIVPITLTVLPCLIVAVAGQSFALPMYRIVRMVEAQPVQNVGGRNLAVIDGHAISVSHLATLLGLPGLTNGPWVLIGDPSLTHALQVESVLMKRDVVVRGLQGRLRDLEVVSGASVEPNGSIALVLDITALLKRAALHLEPVIESKGESAVTVRPPAVMVVDDSLMVRELQRSILERAGYEVRTANDGAEALAMLGDRASDLVVTDIEMPNLDGFKLTEAIRAHPRLANIPVLIVTSRTSEEDHQHGLDSGADGYIVKTSFDEAGLLGAVSQLLGRTSNGDEGHREARPKSAVGARK